MSDVEKQELDNQRYMVENNMFRSDNDVQINIAELFSQDLHTDELVDKEFSEEAISNLIELSKDETYLKDLNEQLKQLIEQLIKEYERENPENLARNAYYCLPTNKYIEFYTDKFIKWQLATRPTCGQEQRKFLDEVEKYGVFEYNIRHGCNQIYIRESEISCDDFTADLSKVIKGE